MNNRTSLDHRIVFVSAATLFVVLGVVNTVYGPALPMLRLIFRLSAPTAGLLPTGQFLGAIAGVGATIALGRRWMIRQFLFVGGLGLVAGCIGIAFTPSWPVILLSSWSIGFGFGTLQVSVVTLVSRLFQTRARKMLNLLHTFLGLGLVLGPLAVAASPPTKPLLAFSGVGLIAALSISCMQKSMASESDQLVTEKSKELLPDFMLSVAILYLFYVGLEVGIGTWEASHLVDVGYSEKPAALLAAGFWASFALGRLVTAFVSERIPDRTILNVCFSAAGCALVGAHLFESIALFYAITGLFLGPVFPTGLVWVNHHHPLSLSSTGLIMGGSMIGGVISPPLIGLAVASYGLPSIPLTMASLCVICLMTVHWVHRHWTVP